MDQVTRDGLYLQKPLSDYRVLSSNRSIWPRGRGRHKGVIRLSRTILARSVQPCLGRFANWLALCYLNHGNGWPLSHKHSSIYILEDAKLSALCKLRPLSMFLTLSALSSSSSYSVQAKSICWPSVPPPTVEQHLSNLMCMLSHFSFNGYKQ